VFRRDQPGVQGETDDSLANPMVTMLEYILGDRRDVHIYDPRINLALYDSNQNFILDAILHMGRLLEPEIDKLLKWADQLVIRRKLGEELTSLISASGRPTLDLVGSSAAVVNSAVSA
jgi:hypothetical protein